MKQNVYNGHHRRSDAEPGMPQGGAAPSRSPQPRYRTPHQRRDFYATTELRGPGAPYSAPSDRSRRNGGTERDEQLRIENERHQESEHRRLRNELLELARELKAMRNFDIGRIGVAGPQSAKPSEARTRPHAMWRSGVPSSGIEQKIQTPLNGDKASGEPVPARNRSAELPSQTPERHPQPIAHPAQQIQRAGINAARIEAAPARAQITPPAVVSRTRTSVKPPAKRSRGIRLKLAVEVALLILLMLAGTALITPKLWYEIPELAPVREKIADLFAHISRPAAKAAPVAQTVAEPTPRATLPFAAPDTYGVYAVSNGQLTALEQLPIRVPDARVSISNTISTPAPAPFTNGRLSFVAYHRDLATSVPENASVRIVAKVTQATDYAGSPPKATAVEETWAVRGGAINLRIAPVPGHQEMVIIRAADPNFTLSPGRYVLMFKNQAYDFSVAGKVTDTAQCLERSDLQGRSVYSECPLNPSQQASF